MGSLVRQELNSRSSLYKEIANAVNEGKLVPDEVIFALLSKRFVTRILGNTQCAQIEPVEIVDQIADIDLVVNFKCTNELGTGNCREYLSMGTSVRNLNLQTKEELLKSSPADAAQVWPLSSVYICLVISTDVGNHRKMGCNPFLLSQTKSPEDYYRKQHKLIDFQVKSAPGETWQGLLAALHLQHINAVNSSQKLTA
ncbi:hypothetical protein C1H46_014831 [Malus baccata]|uniref:Uncharacterized protein n=1 Tax=Malus baccata TaxID=106549 RepID=A0A540ML23_MALBA|nr:hypothetical protein C1H46_014831 [Malus baccata]